VLIFLRNRMTNSFSKMQGKFLLDDYDHVIEYLWLSGWKCKNCLSECYWLIEEKDTHSSAKMKLVQDVIDGE
jgi:hypothetical protein